MFGSSRPRYKQTGGGQAKRRGVYFLTLTFAAEEMCVVAGMYETREEAENAIENVPTKTHSFLFLEFVEFGEYPYTTDTTIFENIQDKWVFKKYMNTKRTPIALTD